MVAGLEEDEDAAAFAGPFLSISSYKSRRKSSLNLPNVAHAAEKPVRLGWSSANWQTLRASKSFGVIKFNTLHRQSLDIWKQNCLANLMAIVCTYSSGNADMARCRP